MKVQYSFECSETELVTLLRETVSAVREIVGLQQTLVTRRKASSEVDSGEPSVFKGDGSVYSYAELMYAIDKLGLTQYKHLVDYPKEEGVSYTQDQVNRILDELQAHKYRSMMDTVDSLNEPKVSEAPAEETSSFGTPAPTNDAVVGKLPLEEIIKKLPKIDPKLRQDAKEYFGYFCVQWALNFGKANEVQPNRQLLMEQLGSSQYLVPILIMAYEKLSLQALVVEGLKNGGYPVMAFDDEDALWDFANQLAMVMVQVSHAGCPDLAGTYDYSMGWKRRKNG